MYTQIFALYYLLHLLSVRLICHFIEVILLLDVIPPLTYILIT